MQKNSQFTFAIPSSGNKWCEITCMVVPEIVLDNAKYNQHHRIWEINISMVFTANDDSKHYDHKIYYFCCISDRWLIGDLINQHFALVCHPLLDRVKLKILEHYPELISAENTIDDPNANSPFISPFQKNTKTSLTGKKKDPIEKLIR